MEVQYNFCEVENSFLKCSFDEFEALNGQLVAIK
jgi:hypothetical protein